MTRVFPSLKNSSQRVLVVAMIATGLVLKIRRYLHQKTPVEAIVLEG